MPFNVHIKQPSCQYLILRIILLWYIIFVYLENELFCPSMFHVAEGCLSTWLVFGSLYDINISCFPHLNYNQHKCSVDLWDYVLIDRNRRWSFSLFNFLEEFIILFLICFHFISMIFSEVILTLGSSKTVLEFLCAAKEKKRSFKVFVAEGAPRLVVEAVSHFQWMVMFN